MTILLLNKYSIAIQCGNTIPFRVQLKYCYSVWQLFFWTKVFYCHPVWQYYTFRSKEVQHCVLFISKFKYCRSASMAVQVNTQKYQPCWNNPCQRVVNLSSVLLFIPLELSVFVPLVFFSVITFRTSIYPNWAQKQKKQKLGMEFALLLSFIHSSGSAAKSCWVMFRVLK